MSRRPLEATGRRTRPLERFELFRRNDPRPWLTLRVRPFAFDLVAVDPDDLHWARDLWTDNELTDLEKHITAIVRIAAAQRTLVGAGSSATGIV